jgi:hypothetical protein
MAVTLALVFACVAAASGFYAWQVTRRERYRSAARVAALAATIDPTGESGSRPLFDRAPAAGLNPLLKIGAGFGVVAVTIAIIAVVTNARPSRKAAADPATSPAIALVDLNHVREGDAFVIRGTVRNQSGAALDGLLAEVTILDATGIPVARAQAPVDLQPLRPGESSRFDVHVQGVHAVERYRVSFQSPAGIVRHIDARDRLTRSTPSRAATASAATASSGF